MRNTLARVAFAVTAAVLVWLAVAVTSASAYTAELTPGEECHGELPEWEIIPPRLMPAEGATVPGGQPVVFSVDVNETTEPVTFEVARSREQLLAGSYLASGPGVSSHGIDTFTLAPPGPGTLYWRLFLSTKGGPLCAHAAEREGLSEWPAVEMTSAVSSFTVLPLMEPASQPAPAPVETKPARKAYAIVGASVIHGAVSLRIHCSASCKGTVSYRILARRDGDVQTIRSLAAGPARVSISNTEGGNATIVNHYPPTLRRRLLALLRAGRVKIDITAELNTRNRHEAEQVSLTLRSAG